MKIRQQNPLQLIICLCIIVVLGACTSTPIRQQTNAANTYLQTLPSSESSTRKVLLQQLNQWRGTPYRLGGMNKSGIDCSGFVHVTFRDLFGRSVPRTTRSLAKIGDNINAKRLKVGDLVFFKTGLFDRHVGIYVGKGEFIHASTSRGVMKSRLNNSYWSKRYWTSRRVHIE